MTESGGLATEWRRLEERFYGSALQEPELYMAAIRLVRAVADGLAAIEDFASLEDRYRELGRDWVIPFAQQLGTPQLALLDYDLVLGAAFCLRAGEIEVARETQGAVAALAAARERGEGWVVLYDRRRERNGFTFSERVEVRPSDGVGLRLTSDLDWERGAVYGVERVRLDPETGRPEPGEVGARRELASEEEQSVEADRLREELSASSLEGGA